MKKVPFTLTQIQKLIKEHSTPFYVYDEVGIRNNIRELYKTFSWVKNFKNYFAVKALPNPSILKLLKEEGCGVDCSSLGELVLAEKSGFSGEDIMFTSNNTPANEYIKASELKAIVNFDDITHIDFYKEYVGSLPKIASFRFNPGALKQGNAIIGKPKEAKFGLTASQMMEAYKILIEGGVKRFGIHTMVASNELDSHYFNETIDIIFNLVVDIYNELGIKFEFINIGGGLGIPYKENEERLNIEEISDYMKKSYDTKIIASGHGDVSVVMESGRYISGPFGYLVTTLIHTKDTYKKYAGVDATMANLMRPGMYGAYHYISVLGKKEKESELYDITGSLCENNDKFAIDRVMQKLSIGDVLVIHDVGAHGHAMGFQYNAKLRSAEFLLKKDGSFEMIRRAETLDDYFATLF